MKKAFAACAIIILLISACSQPPQDTDNDSIATSVAETMAAAGGSDSNANVADDAQDEDIYHTGTVEGRVCFPSEYLPAMYLYLANVNTQETTIISIPENQGNFSGGVPEGTYVAYAWLQDYSGGGTYSQAVPCGLSVNCTDHSLLEFEVVEDQTTSGIEVCDWYGSQSDVPIPPGQEGNYGAISGYLGYPSEFIPAMQVVATNAESHQFFYVNTAENQDEFTIVGLPPGNYYVIAYPQLEGGDDFGGGYSEFVECGQTVDCTDHSLIAVPVSAGQTTFNIQPIDFYAPPGTFPSNPMP